jgi:hypothetical protein
MAEDIHALANAIATRLPFNGRPAAMLAIGLAALRAELVARSASDLRIERNRPGGPDEGWVVEIEAPWALSLTLERFLLRFSRPHPDPARLVGDDAGDLLRADPELSGKSMVRLMSLAAIRAVKEAHGRALVVRHEGWVYRIGRPTPLTRLDRAIDKAIALATARLRGRTTS